MRIMITMMVNDGDDKILLITTVNFEVKMRNV